MALLCSNLSTVERPLPIFIYTFVYKYSKCSNNIYKQKQLKIAENIYLITLQKGKCLGNVIK